VPVQVRCPNCGALLQVKESLIGKRGKGVSCATIIELQPQELGTYQIQEVPESSTAPGQELSLRPAEPSAGLECARCHRPLSRLMDLCPHCGADPFTGKPAPRKLIPERKVEEPPGILKLSLMVLARPIRTLENILYYLGYVDMLVKMGVLYLLTLFMLMLCLYFYVRAQNISLPLSLIPWMMAQDMLGIAVSAFAVNLIARWLSSGNYIGILVAFAYLAGLVRGVLLVIILAAALGIVTGTTLTYVVISFFIWMLVLQLLAIRGVYDIGVGMALVTDILAGFILWFLGNPLKGL